MKAFIALAFLFSTMVQAVELEDYPRDSEGDLLLLHFEQAQAFCEARGTRLPTIREYMDFATKYGNKIRETAFPSERQGKALIEERIRNAAEGYFAVFNGKSRVDFYFNPREYSYPGRSILETIGHWTLSRNPSRMIYSIHWEYLQVSTLDVDEFGWSAAFRCLKKENK